MRSLFGRHTYILTVTGIVLSLAKCCLADPELSTTSTPRVFTETNAAAGNSILVYDRGVNGALTLVQTVPTGQNGTGALLNAQGALLLLSHYLLAVNAGSDSITVLDIGAPSVKVISTASSGGTQPKSLSSNKDLVYVLNEGASGNITGFTFDTVTGNLTPIPGSTRPLSGKSDPQPGQIGFAYNGQALIVTEKNTNTLDVYPVNASGVAGMPTTYSSNAPTPYGFADGKLSRVFVTEANEAAPLGSSVSSYQMSQQHVPEIISGSVGTGQSGACWVVLSSANTFAYVTDNGSKVISVLSVDSEGRLTLIPSFNVPTSYAPFDIAISGDQKNVYVLYSAAGSITAYTVDVDGGLTPGTSVSVSSTVSSGLVVR